MKRCDVRGCPNRIPPSDYWGGISFEDIVLSFSFSAFLINELNKNNPSKMGIVPTTRMLAEKPIKDPDTADTIIISRIEYNTIWHRNLESSFSIGVTINSNVKFNITSTPAIRKGSSKYQEPEMLERKDNR